MTATNIFYNFVGFRCSCNLQQLHLSTSKELSGQWLYRESCSSKKSKKNNHHTTAARPNKYNPRAL